MTTERDHGGDLAAATRAFGGAPADWIDLSTGINRVPWPVPPVSPHAWTALPGREARDRLIAAARCAYGTDWPILPLGGAQAAIQLLPALAPDGAVRIVTPTYNEYAGVLALSGRVVEGVPEAAALAGAGMAILVNPNNPDGRRVSASDLRGIASCVGLLVVDESFADPHPELSLLTGACPENVIVLRSFGKFYGLAGLRLGFALGARAHLDRIAAMAGPWSVSGPALEIGAAALCDADWRAVSTARLGNDAVRADKLARDAGWNCLGGTALFRLYETPDSTAARAQLGRARIWSRVFPWSPRALRLGLPGSSWEWARLGEALAREA
ncbi:aminotransferase class I/II-fold pyridoxal phosphate-dependent enzyme [Rhodovulum steppense]|uniref:Aminotransferase n=1 Tax=Rhodovulum steppense TaxID=540251 RepID=A0A4V2R4Y9_9RHOB|nr:aminotransferase class I/II-fold pyridoxal phosphate-dependent enzyme [Rhodovulum steppense]TCM86594.1 L-threonine O-3-phosphate decarboxylase [Rhodovulum steppense]